MNGKKDMIAYVLLTLMLIGMLFISYNTSSTNDEFNHVAKGYLYLKEGEMLILSNPPLTNIISASPLLLINANIPSNHTDYYLQNQFSEFAYEFMYKSLNNPREITFLSRIPSILIAAILGFMIYFLIKSIFNSSCALIAVILYSFNPLILGNAPIANTDFIFSALFFIASIYLYFYFKEPSLKKTIMLGLLIGAAITAKSSGIFLLPLFGIFLIIELVSQKKKFFMESMKIHLANIFVIGVEILIVINLVYGFQGSFQSLGTNLRSDPSQYFDKETFNTEAVASMLSIHNPILYNIGTFVIGNVPEMLPYPFLKDIFTAFKISNDWKGGYLFGQYNPDGYGYYFPVVFFFKNPITLWILFLVGLAYLIRYYKKFKRELLYLIIPPLLLFLLFLNQRINSGARYVMPAVFFLIIISALSIMWLEKLKHKTKKRVFIITSALILLTLMPIVYFPNMLSYANILAGGPSNAHNIMADTNIDYGQDLPALKKYVEKNQIKNLSVALYAIEDLNYYGIEYYPLSYLGEPLINGQRNLRCYPVKGIIAISVTYLHGKQEPSESCFSWLRALEPVDHVGYSILIYDTRDIED